MYQKYPKVGSVMIQDPFWTPYLSSIRSITLPYVFEKMEQTGYIANFASLAVQDGKEHIGPPYSDGLFFEVIRGACDFLAAQQDAVLEDHIDGLIEMIAGAQAEDGFLCTKTIQNYPDKRWGDNDGDIVEQHDLYDHGCLIEAAISHYNEKLSHHS